MPPIHPDLTAYRAVDACGGKYSNAEHLSGYAAGHMDALEAACKAVAKPDALMAEMLEALKAAEHLYLHGIVGVTAEEYERVHSLRRAVIAKAESSPSTVGGR